MTGPAADKRGLSEEWEKRSRWTAGDGMVALADSEEHSQEWLCYWAARRQVRWRGSEWLRRWQVAQKIGDALCQIIEANPS
jgi:hypothetical protein